MVGSGDILGLLPTGRHTDTTDRTGRHLLALLAGDPLCPSRFLPVLREILLVAVRADLLVLGVVSPLAHSGDGESHWGLGGLGIGVVKIFNVRTVGKAVLEPSKKEEESGSTSFIEVENLHRLH